VDPFSARVPQRALNGSTERAAPILAATGQREGYAVAWGAAMADLARALVRQSKLHVVIVEPDAAKVRKLRDELTAEELYGTRIAVVPGDPKTVTLPPYFASLMIADDNVPMASCALVRTTPNRFQNSRRASSTRPSAPSAI
jgi:hypothetical protein